MRFHPGGWLLNGKQGIRYGWGILCRAAHKLKDWGSLAAAAFAFFVKKNFKIMTTEQFVNMRNQKISKTNQSIEKF
jgi:hypothetical protein